MSRERSPSEDGGRDRDGGTRATVAHELRSNLNGLHLWVQVLDARLGESPDPVVLRALQGLREAVARQIDIVENRLEAGAVQPPLRTAMMSKRNDAQPDIPDDIAQAERPSRPGPSPMKPESPGGPRESKAEEDAKNKATRKGER